MLSVKWCPRCGDIEINGWCVRCGDEQAPAESKPSAADPIPLGYRELACAVLRSAVEDLDARAPETRASAERFFREGDDRAWCAVCGLEVDAFRRALQRRQERHGRLEG